MSGSMLKIAMVLTAGLAPVAQAQAGLVGHWTFDENPAGNGGQVADAVGPLLQHGTLTTSIGNASVPGVVGGAIHLDRHDPDLNAIPDDIVIDLAADFVSGANPATASIWINPDSITFGGANTQNFILVWGDDQLGENVRLTLEEADGSSVIRNRYQGGFVTYNTASITADSGWHHLAAVIPDSAANPHDIILYLDGVAIAGTPSNAGHVLNVLGDDPVFGTKLYVGSRHSNKDHAFDGQIDDLGFWNEALSAQQIAAIHQGGLQGLNLQQALVPEPASLALMGMGALVLLRRRRAE